ncbi:MAG: hypothetical protein FJZ89_13215 [Chloroflexi bacterium]|nr:hypothetical protein [Chloroflexota bacterium]
MPIRSRFIYAGNTPLTSTITVELEGKYTLVLRAGSFTTTGQAEIISRTPGTVEILEKRLREGWAEALPGGAFIRHWLPGADGKPQRSRTVTLGEDLRWELAPDDQWPKEAGVEVVVSEKGDCDLWLWTRLLDGIEERAEGAAPPGWHTEHTLVFAFVIPPKLPDLSMVDIDYLAVLSGSPPASGPTIQIGRA